MDKTTISVIIPCFNDGANIIPIYKIIKSCQFINEIIIVNDGSNQQTKQILNKLSGIKLVTHPTNLGKSAALKSGFLTSHGDIIIFLDSDLINLQEDDIRSLVNPIISSNYDITLSDRKHETFYNRLIGFSVAFTGDRAMSRKILEKNMDIFNSSGYLIEASINQRFFGKYKIAKVSFNNVYQQSKYSKIGIKGFVDDFKMLINIIKYLGLQNFLFQIKTGLLLPSV
jgi:polyisoprenyl-phosphate glycosyltransferase